MPWKVSWKVTVDGRDVTSHMQPFLIDIEIADKDGTASDTCSLTFDDTHGQALLPKDGAKVQVFLQGALKFAGTVDSVKSSGSRGGGRLLKVNAKGFDSRGKIKEPQSFHRDDASLGDFVRQAGRQAGISNVIVGEKLAGIMRDYWAADGESFLHLGQRLAREFNATFKIRAGEGGDIAVLVPRDQTTLGAVRGVVGPGGNVISWDIAPFTGRKVFTKGKVSYFDRESASFKSEEIEFDLDRDLPEAANIIRSTAANKDQARDIAEARKSEAQREGGEGSVEMDLEIAAQAEAPFILTGARPGVDGTYRIVSVRHRASRSGGSTTSLELKQPQGGAGTDNRKTSTGGSQGQSAQASPAQGGQGGQSGGSTGFEGSPELPGQN